LEAQTLSGMGEVGISWLSGEQSLRAWKRACISSALLAELRVGVTRGTSERVHTDKERLGEVAGRNKIWGGSDGKGLRSRVSFFLHL